MNDLARRDDLILEGASAAEVACLHALDRGETMPAHDEIAPLRAKGWVEVIGKDTIITLTGRALLDGRSSKLR